jgi:subtilisin family serine protease
MSQLINFIPDIKSRILSVISTLSVDNNWGLKFIDVEEAWKHSKGQNVKVAIIDTGWFPHKDLVCNFIEGHDATGGNDFMDHGNGHSTHVAGIIAGNSSDESFGVTGIAPDAKIVIIKSLDDSGSGSFDYICRALQIAKGLDVDVINMSLGTPMAPDNEEMHNLIKELANQNKIIVCAAGNDGSSVNYPAKYDEVIAVAAVDSSGNMARFSSRGPELDTAAPGVQIYSTWLNNQYVKLDGTSMACPAITGIISLIISWMKAHGKQNDINVKNMIKILQELGGDEGQHIVQVGLYDIGVPKFCNFTDWN